MIHTRRAVIGRALVLLTAVVLLGAACESTAPSAGPGTLTARLSPASAADGAMLLAIPAEGIRAIHEIPDRVIASKVGGTWFVAVISPAGGDLSFRVDVDDMSKPPSAKIREIATTDNNLRALVADYAVDFRR
jgi:hypothetical protein